MLQERMGDMTRSKGMVWAHVSRGCRIATAAGSLLGALGCAPSERESDPVARAQSALVLSETGTEIGEQVWFTKHVKEGIYAGNGTADYENGVFTLTAEQSWGLKNTHEQAPFSDNIQFAYVKLPPEGPSEGPTHSGDIELVVRVTSIPEGVPGEVQAGVMIRASDDAEAAMGAAFFSYGASAQDVRSYQECPTCPSIECPAWPVRLNSFSHANRTHHGLAASAPEPRLFPVVSPFDSSWNPPDVYLRLQRVGTDYSVSRSDDGTRWVTMLGGAFEPAPGEVPLAGIYVGGEPAGSNFPLEVTFEVVYVGTPRLEYKTVAIGSSFTADSTDWVSRGMQGFYVAPSGSSYKYTFEPLDALPPGDGSGYHAFTKFDGDGVVEEIPSEHTTGGVVGVLQGGITGEKVDDEEFVYFGRATLSATEPYFIEKRRGTDLGVIGHFNPTSGALGKIGGMAARDGKLYVSEFDSGKIRVFDTDTLDEIENLSFTFPLTRPGPLAVDHSGRVWVAHNRAGYIKCAGIRTPCDDPGGASPVAMQNFLPEPCPPEPPTCEPSSISRCDQTGCSVQIESVVNPTALAISPNGGTSMDERLLIADNGPDQNVKVCSDLGATPPTCTEFGQTEGVFADPPGLMVSGATPRFFSPIGVGVDDTGAVYVASAAPKVQIQKFSSLETGSLAWSRYGLGPDPGAFDPKTDGSDYYSLTRHYTFDPDDETFDPVTKRMVSGWSPKSVTLNPFSTYPELPVADSNRLAPTLPGVAPILRRIKAHPMDTDPALFMFVQGIETVPGSVFINSTFDVYRFEGEVARPCASLRFVLTPNPTPEEAPWRPQLWIDKARGMNPPDGLVDTDELEPLDRSTLRYAPAQQFAFDVDENADIWLSFGGQIKHWSGVDTGNVWRLRLAGVTDGVPVYDWAHRDVIDLPDELPLGISNIANAPAFIRYDVEHSALYLLGGVPIQSLENYETATATCNGDGAHVVVRYDMTNLTNGTVPITVAEHYPVALPSPSTILFPARGPDDPAGFPTDPSFPLLCKCDITGAYRAFDIAGDMFFVQENHWNVHVHGKVSGEEQILLAAGPEVSGHQSVADHSLGVMRAFQRQNGEYLVTLSDTVAQARTLLFRWKPKWTPEALAPMAWYSAAGQIDDGDPGSAVAVERWHDRTSHDRDVIQEIGMNRPSFDPNGWDGEKPAVSFNGSTAFLYSHEWDSDPPTGTESPYTVLAVIEPSTIQRGGIASWYGTFGGGWVAARLASNGTTLTPQSLRYGELVDTHGFTSTFNLATGDKHMIAYRYDGAGTFWITVDGQPHQPSNQLSTLSNIGADEMPFLIGWEDAHNNYKFAGKMAELIIVDRAISDAEVESFYAYAHEEWGAGI